TLVQQEGVMFQSRATVFFISTVLSIGCLLAQEVPFEAQEPVNPKSSQKTRDVLRLLYDLPNRSDKKVISGQTLHVFNGLQFTAGKLIKLGSVVPDVFKRVSDIHDKFGVWVGIAGAEYTDWGNFTPVSKIMSKELNPSLIAHSQRGGIVQLHFHPVNPL